MDSEKYIKNVLVTESKDFDQIRQRTSIRQYIRLDHAADGLVTEAGEFKDILKKFKFYGKPVNVDNLIEELGDILWYSAIACDVLKISFDAIMDLNIEKLKVRYQNEFNEKEAIDRDLDREDKVFGDDGVTGGFI